MIQRKQNRTGLLPAGDANKKTIIDKPDESGNIGDSFLVFITGTTVILAYRSAVDDEIVVLPAPPLQLVRDA